MVSLNEAQRRAVLANVLKKLERKFVNPGAECVDIAPLRARHEDAIVGSSSADEFEQAINDMLQSLGTSHTGFFHEAAPRAAGRIAIAATTMQADTSDGRRWVFQDVHPGGIAARAGIAPGDVLLTLQGEDVVAPGAALFVLGREYSVTVRKPNGASRQLHLALPSSTERKRPLIVPDQVVTASRLDGDVGLIRVTMFPGMVGIEVAREITRAIHDLDCRRLIFDLRGNTGGGIGCLRLMSHLCPDTRGVGYSVGRDLLKRGFDKRRLPRFDRIPASKLALIPLALRFITRGTSVAVFSEGLETQKHHGKVVILVNEHSASATEMVAAFASEYKLATLVGTRTPGRLVAARSFKVGFGYRVAFPVAAYFTWVGTNLEGRGIQPDVEEQICFESLKIGMDIQLRRAQETVRMKC